MKNRFYSIVSFGTCAIIICFGAWLFNIGREFNKSYNFIQGWPSAQAIVTSHEIYEIPRSPNRKSVIRDRWTPVWHYSFALEGISYLSHSMSYADVMITTYKASKTDAENELMLRPIGTQFKIFYNPLQPRETIIEKWPRNSSKEYFYYFLGVVLAVMGICGV